MQRFSLFARVAVCIKVLFFCLSSYWCSKWLHPDKTPYSFGYYNKIPIIAIKYFPEAALGYLNSIHRTMQCSKNWESCLLSKVDAVPQWPLTSDLWLYPLRNWGEPGGHSVQQDLHPPAFPLCSWRGPRGGQGLLLPVPHILRYRCVLALY